jgi:hypothetical protein
MLKKEKISKVDEKRQTAWLKGAERGYSAAPWTRTIWTRAGASAT